MSLVSATVPGDDRLVRIGQSVTKRDASPIWHFSEPTLALLSLKTNPDSLSRPHTQIHTQIDRHRLCYSPPETNGDHNHNTNLTLSHRLLKQHLIESMLSFKISISHTRNGSCDAIFLHSTGDIFDSRPVLAVTREHKGYTNEYYVGFVIE